MFTLTHETIISSRAACVHYANICSNALLCPRTHKIRIMWFLFIFLILSKRADIGREVKKIAFYGCVVSRSFAWCVRHLLFHVLFLYTPVTRVHCLYIYIHLTYVRLNGVHLYCNICTCMYVVRTSSPCGILKVHFCQGRNTDAPSYIFFTRLFFFRFLSDHRDY